MALPATDNFNGGVQGQQLTTYSASWTLCLGDFAIEAGGADSLACDNNAADAGAGWNADAFNANQYSEATVVAIAAVAYIGLAVRCDDDTPDDYYYGYYADSGDASYLFKVVNGAWTQLDTGNTFSATDVLYLEVDGVDPGSLTAKINGGTDCQANDSDIDAGSAGVSGWGNDTSSRIDDWEGGNLGGAPVTGVAALAGAGNASIIGLVISERAAALSGTGALSAAGLQITSGIATLSGTGALSAIGAVAGEVTGIAALTGTGNLVAIGDLFVLAVVALSGTGDLSAVGQVGVILTAVQVADHIHLSWS